MNVWFADTFYWLALLNADDEKHDVAVALQSQLKGKFFTTQWVFMEFLNTWNAPSHRCKAAAFVRALQSQSNMSVIPATEDWFNRGASLFEQRPDKEWSLTDCISFLVMEEYQISEALTGDHHFEQAGFTALLKD
jgi:predicted nucleic acid-binding protein